MSHYTADRLYDLLPALYRVRDAAVGEPLRALVRVLAEQAQVLEGDIERLYDNLFIETCEEWVVPYIGDLLGVGNLYAFAPDAAFSQRARVANTLAYRRRKGTAPMLEQLAFDTTGWRARAVEFFLRLGWTQHLNHVRPENVRTLDLRDANRLELVGGAFDPAAYTADVRPIAEGAARPNIPNVGLYLWRLAPFFIPRSQARPVATPADGRFTFHPFGLDAPLFNRPQTEAEITHLADEINVPAPLRRRELYDELEARRQALAEGRTPEYRYFDSRPDAAHPPVFEVFFDEIRDGAGRFVPVPLDEVMICDLSRWDDPAWTPPGASKTYRVQQPDGTSVDVAMPIRAAVDPALGRLALPTTETPGIVHVSYAHGFSGDVGGGPYNRRATFDADLVRQSNWTVGVGRAATLDALGLAPDGTTFFTSLVDAVVAWSGLGTRGTGTIVLLDNSTVEENLTGPARIEVGEGEQLLVVAADWPGWLAGRLPVPDERRAHLNGTVEVVGTAPEGSEAPGEVTFDGVWIEGLVTVQPGHLGQLTFKHSTLVEGVEVDASDAARPNAGLRLELEKCISGPIFAPRTVREVRVSDSLLHRRGLLTAAPDDGSFSLAADASGAAPGPATVLDRTTVFGRVRAETLEASEVIFVASVVAERVQTGCVRFSYVPPDRPGQLSRTPRRYRCQPDLALDARAEALGVPRASLSPAEARRVRLRVVPAFTSTRYGHPALGQLGAACPSEIRTGAEDGSEMGAFSFLKNPQREANLRASLDEYLRLGLEAGLLFAT